jgi:hypothetical protein
MVARINRQMARRQTRCLLEPHSANHPQGTVCHRLIVGRRTAAFDGGLHEDGDVLEPLLAVIVLWLSSSCDLPIDMRHPLAREGST